MLIQFFSLIFLQRDLNTVNVLINENNQIRITNFKFAIRLPAGSGKLNTYVGTEIYKAPEIYNRKEYSGEKVDFWLLGTILYELVCGIKPRNDLSMYERVAQGEEKLR